MNKIPPMARQAAVNSDLLLSVSETRKLLLENPCSLIDEGDTLIEECVGTGAATNYLFFKQKVFQTMFSFDDGKGLLLKDVCLRSPNENNLNGNIIFIYSMNSFRADRSQCLYLFWWQYLHWFYFVDCVAIEDQQYIQSNLKFRRHPVHLSLDLSPCYFQLDINIVTIV